MPRPQHDRRDRRSRPIARDGNATAGPSTARPKPRPIEMRDPSGLPGLSKLKASIRQTKRMLAKEDLEPGMRIATQRRLTSLEADLVKAQKRDIEKKNGERYHKVKFFERQKVLRFIKRFKKQLKEDEQAEEALFRARVMLNYILHFPNDRKYISLFPPDTSKSEEASTDGKSVVKRLFPTSQEALRESEQGRHGILQEIQRRMQDQEMSNEPEMELDLQTGEHGKRKREQLAMPTTQARNDSVQEAERGASKKAKQSNGNSTKKVKGDGGERTKSKGSKVDVAKEVKQDEEQDDFFELE